MSSMVPVPMTCDRGSPEASVMTAVRTSTGLVTITRMPLKPASFAAMPRTMAALSRSRSSRVSPSRPPRPAVTTIAPHSRMPSMVEVRT